MSGRILIIDDVATNRITMRVKLAASQYEVSQAASLRDGIIAITADPPDLVIVDLGVGAVACTNFCTRLRANRRTSHISIIVTSIAADAQGKLEVLSAGADDVLQKPLDENLLLARIRGLLRARSAEGELRLRDDTKRALGFSEASKGFERSSHLAIVSGSDQAEWNAALADCNNLTSRIIPADQVFDPKALLPRPDLFVVDATGGNAIHALRLLSELRSRDETRLAGIIAVADHDRPDVAAMALDLGANDLIGPSASQGERALRVRTQIRRKLQNDRLRADLRNGIEAAVTDPLTGLFNRRYALPHLERMAERAHRGARGFAVMVLDIDHFKAINDTHGHDAGDRVLEEVANRIKSSLRAIDMVARIGGEEFLIALPDTTAQSARIAAARLCSAIHDSRFLTGNGGPTLQVTASIGLAITEPGEAIGTGEIMKRADTALYEAKNSGRDRVTVSTTRAA